MHHVISNRLDFIKNSCTAKNICWLDFTAVKKYIRTLMARTGWDHEINSELKVVPTIQG